MDCHDARLLLTLHRREPDQLDLVELGALERHVEFCPGCQAWNRGESRFDSAVTRAMVGVEVPSGLRAAILTKVAAHRPPARWPWMAAAAAVLLGIVSVGYWHWSQPVVVDLWSVDFEHEPTLEAAEQYFADLGYSMVPPIHFDYRYLHGYQLAPFQGRMTPKLTFRALHRGQYVTAQVYCLSPGSFRIDDDTPLPSHRDVRIWQGEGDIYVIDCVGGDLSLLLRQTS